MSKATFGAKTFRAQAFSCGTLAGAAVVVAPAEPPIAVVSGGGFVFEPSWGREDTKPKRKRKPLPLPESVPSPAVLQIVQQREEEELLLLLME